MPEQERKSIGGLWTKKDKNGNHFFSGMVEVGGVKQDIVIFKNKWKEEGSKQPDWKILKSELKPKPQEDDPF